MAFNQLIVRNNQKGDFAFDFERFDSFSSPVDSNMSFLDSNMSFKPQHSVSQYPTENSFQVGSYEEKPLESERMVAKKGSYKGYNIFELPADEPENAAPETMMIEFPMEKVQETTDARFEMLPDEAFIIHRKKRSILNWFGKFDIEIPLRHVIENNDSYRRSFTKIYKNAHRGDSDSQCELGLLYYYGHNGVMQSTGDALYWLKLASLRNNHRAQCTLGVIYICMEDFVSARNWFEEAARDGSAWGYYHLGVMYYLGQITNQRDSELAFAMFKKAAKKWHMIAANNVGVMYMNGDGVMKNEKKAVKWFKKAANACAYSDHNLGLMYLNGISVQRDGWTAALLFDRAKSHDYEEILCPHVDESLHEKCIANDLFLALIQHRF